MTADRLLSRRCFIASAGAALVATSVSWAKEEFPALLDHIILGCNDLEGGIAFVEQRVGVRAARGGVHPGRGTMNALLSLGERHYLEIMAPNPEEKAVEAFAVPQLNALKNLARPQLITWAVHVTDVESVAKKLRESGISIQGPWAGSRKRPDGRILSWKTLSLSDDRDGLLPFFIQWSTDSLHPSTDAPAGCRLEHFAAADRDPDELASAFERIGVEVPVERGDKPQLRARIAGPKGVLAVSS